MAGYIKNTGELEREFHIDDENVVQKIREANSNRRVLTLQLDGDELEAALWGFENYQKVPNAYGFTFATKEEAQKVIDGIRDLLDQYAVVTVSDVKQLVGIPPTYVNTKHGWGDFGNHLVIHKDADGYELVLPKPKPIRY